MTIRFFVATSINQDGPSSLFELLSKYADVKAPIINAADDAYQMKVFASNDKKVIAGSFRRFKDGTAWIGTQDDADEELLELEPGQHIIERNHFLLSQEGKSEVLVYEVNIDGSHVTRFAKYLSDVAGNGTTTSFSEILTEDSYALLEEGVIKCVEYTVAMPRSKQFQPDPEDTLTREAIEKLTSTGARRLSVRLATRSDKGLLQDVKNMVKLLADSDVTRKLKVKVSELQEPIDLLADQIRDRRVFAPANGKKATTNEIIRELAASKKAKQPDIDSVLNE